MSYGDILLMILTSQKALASIGSQCLFLSLVLLRKQVQIIVQIRLQVQKYVRLSHEFRAYIFVTFIGGIDPFCEPAAGDEIVYL